MAHVTTHTKKELRPLRFALLVLVFGLVLPLSCRHVWKGQLLDIGWPQGLVVSRAESWTVYALEPSSDPLDHPGVERFRGYAIRGQRTVEDAGLRRRLSRELNLGLSQNGHWWTGSTVAMCFNPRHGIRATHEGRTVDVLICFECYQVKIFDSAKEGERLSELTSRSPAAAFNEIFEGLGLSIAPDHCAQPDSNEDS